MSPRVESTVVACRSPRTIHAIRTWLVTVSAASLAASFGCVAAPCDGLDTVSESSHGAFTYTTTTSSVRATSTVRGTIGAADGLDIEAASTSAILVTGSFDAGMGPSQDFSLYLTGLASGTTSAFGADSKACLGNVSECVPVQGTIDVSTFATVCHRPNECALTIVGTLSAVANWSGGSFNVNLSLAHESAWQTYACPSGSTTSASPEGS